MISTVPIPDRRCQATTRACRPPRWRRPPRLPNAPRRHRTSRRARTSLSGVGRNEVAPRVEREERELLGLDRLAPPSSRSTTAATPTAHVPASRGLRGGLERRASGRHHVLDDGDPAAAGCEARVPSRRRFEPVVLRVLADVDRVSEPPRWKLIERDGARERAAAQLHPGRRRRAARELARARRRSSAPTSACPSAVRTVCLQSMKKSLSLPDARTTFLRANERSRRSSSKRARSRATSLAWIT